MFGSKKYTLYTFLLHSIIISLFLFGGFNFDNNEKDKVSKVIEIDLFKEINDSIEAETIIEESIIQEILEMENLSKFETTVDKLERESSKEAVRAKEARIYQNEKERIRKIETEKLKIKKENERKRIEKENKVIQDKINKENAKLKKEIDKKAKSDLIIAKAKIKKDEDLKKKKNKDNERKKELENKKMADLRTKEILKNKKRNQTKEEWLETIDGKRDFNIYSNALYSNVYSQWVKPFHAKSGWSCELEVYQDKNGVVKHIKKIECNQKNQDLINSVQKAIMKASPLPLPKDPRLFDNTVIFRFSVE